MRSAIIIYLVTKPDVVEAGPVFIPCRHLDSPHRAGLLPPAHCLQRTHCRHPDTERRLPSCPIFPTLHFPRLSLPPSPQKAMRRTHAHSIPGHPAGARRARSVWYRANRYRQDRRLRAANPSNASPPFHDQRRRKPTGASRERSFPHGGPRVRILLPPAGSLLRTCASLHRLAGIAVQNCRTPLQACRERSPMIGGGFRLPNPRFRARLKPAR